MAARNNRKFLSTSALTLGLIALGAGSALAMDDFTTPTGEQVVGGSATFDRPAAGQLNINQNTDRVVINWDSFNIGSKGKTEFFQPNSGSLAVNRVTSAGTDPTQILGTLKANGKVMVLDRNGVFFGHDAVLDVGTIVASTGDIDTSAVMRGDTVLELSSFGDGSIINNGMISVGNAGLAAFVAPHVANNGIIQARLGKVVLASGGERATVDLYGDGLVQIAVDGAKTRALAENNGSIDAEGGTVLITAAAAKEVVDNVINMNGVIKVSSVTQKGGKIILSGGSSGKVNVKGTLDASGENGGQIEVRGQDIDVGQTALLLADGGRNSDGGRIVVFGDSYAVLNGRATARGGLLGGNGGFIELSSLETVGFDGEIDLSAAYGALGTFLIDPRFIIIHSGSADEPHQNNTPLANKYVLSASSLAEAIKSANVVLLATDFIDVGTRNSYSGILLSGETLPAGLGADDIDISATLKKKNELPPQSSGCSSSNPGSNPNCSGNYQITTGNLTLQSATVNFNKNLTMGAGNLIVDAGTLNLGAKIYGRSTIGGAQTVLQDSRLTGTAAISTVNVLSPGALINQGISFADDSAALTTINVGAGIYNESVLANKGNVVLKGAANFGSLIAPNSPGFKITASNVTVDGFSIMNPSGADGYGVWVDHASGATVKNNLIQTTAQDGIFADGAASLTISNNQIGNTSGDGIDVRGSAGANISGNQIGTIPAFGANNINGSGINITGSDNVTVGGFGAGQGNSVTGSAVGIRIQNSDAAMVAKNTVNNSGWDAIQIVDSSDNAQVLNNDINGVTGASGIAVMNNSHGAVLDGNTIDDTARLGIYVMNSNGLNIKNNLINNAGLEGSGWYLSGIHLEGANNTTVDNNEVKNARGDGIYGGNTSNATIKNNVLVNANTGLPGYGAISTDFGSNLTISGNDIDGSAGHGIRVNGATGTNLIDGNFVDGVSQDGVRAESVSGLTVSGNQIGQTGTIGGNGVSVINSASASIHNNLAGNFSGAGIFVDPSPFTSITGNTVNGGQIGIHVLDSDDVTVGGFGEGEGNTITGSDTGILVENSDSANVLHNAIYGAGTGVHVLDSAYADILGNTVQGYGYGTGVLIENGDNARIGGRHDGNDVDSFWNGIAVSGSDNVRIRHNDVSNIGNDGIQVFGGNHVLISRNDISDVGNDGIYVGDMSAWNYEEESEELTPNVIIRKNNIDWTGNNGIAVSNVNFSLIEKNNVGLDGGYDEASIGGNGITVVGYSEDDPTIIRNNLIANVENNGIFVGGVADVAIGDNTLWNIGNDGISVEDAWYNVTISGNYVGAPRMVMEGDETSFIGGGFIGGHGISVDDSDTVNILDNTVFAAGGDGIRATDNYDVTISGNDVFFSSDDGIDVYDAEYADIFDNTIVFSGDDGIFAGDVYSSYIEDNLIVLSGNNGISVEGGYETFIEDNFVALSVNNGIAVEGTGNPEYGEDYYYGYAEGGGPDWTVNILNNKVALSGQHGIAAYDTGSIRIDGNEVALSGTDFMGWIENLLGGIGESFAVEGEGDDEPLLFGLVWGDGDGIHVENAYRYSYHHDDGDYFQNYAYPDDSEYESLPAVSITNNNVSWTGGDGIDVSDSSSVLIANNTVDASGIAVTVFDFYEVMEHISSLNFEQVLSDLGSVVAGEGSLIEFLEDVLPTPYETLRSDGNGVRLDGNESVHLLSNLINNSGAAGLYAAGDHNGEIVLEDNTFNNNPLGALFESGLIDLTGETNIFNGGDVALRFAPALPEESEFERKREGSEPTGLNLVDNTIGTTEFNGQSQYYVELQNGALFAPGTPTIIDGLNATYDGFRPSSVGGVLTQAQYDALEGKIFHYNDQSDLGLFFFGLVPSQIDQEDIYNRFAGFTPGNNGFRMTILGLPGVGGNGGRGGNGGAGNLAGFLANIAPAAGGNGGNGGEGNSLGGAMENIEPAAGGSEETSCWADAMNSAFSGKTVSYSFGSSPEEALSDTAACSASAG